MTKGLLSTGAGLLMAVMLGSSCAPRGPVVASASPTPTSASPSAQQAPSAKPSPTPSPSASPIRFGSGTWQRSKLMSSPRADFAAALLPGGKVLLAGGQVREGSPSSTTTATATVDLFDPMTNSIGAAAPMKTARLGHTATSLPNGKVLVAGGMLSGPSRSLASAELYDPATNTWSPAAAMEQARSHHVAILMSNGKVIVVGGVGGGAGGGASAPAPTGSEVYDPGTNTWTLLQASYGPRSTGPIAVQLRDGRVVIEVVPGGTEIYNPATGQISYGRSLSLTERSNPTAALLGNGTILIAGGAPLNNPGEALSTTEIYDISKDGNNAAWSSGPEMNVGHCQHTMTALGNGLILVAGGQCPGPGTIAAAELYDPSAKSWSLTGPLQDARGYHVAVLLADGRVFVAGGRLQGYTTISATTEIYAPA